MKILTKKGILTIFLLLLSIAFSLRSNLYWLSLYNKPKLRGNHVGLSIACFVLFWLIVFMIRHLIQKRK